MIPILFLYLIPSLQVQQLSSRDIRLKTRQNDKGSETLVARFQIPSIFTCKYAKVGKYVRTRLVHLPGIITSFGGEGLTCRKKNEPTGRRNKPAGRKSEPSGRQSEPAGRDLNLDKLVTKIRPVIITGSIFWLFAVPMSTLNKV